MPTGATIGQVTVELDWQAFGGTNPSSPGTTNCFPREKSFVLKAPNGTNITLFPTRSFNATQTNCPRSYLLFTDTGATAITTTTTIPAA